MRVTKQIDKLVEAIIEGADALAVNTKLKALEGQKAGLEDKLAAAPDAEPLLHPALATIFRDKVERLEASLRQPDAGREAFELIRGLIDAITLTPTTTQTQHVEAASTNHSLLASVNHGKPAIAATSKSGDFSGHGVVGAKDLKPGSGGPGQASTEGGPGGPPGAGQASTGGGPGGPGKPHEHRGPGGPPGPGGPGGQGRPSGPGGPGSHQAGVPGGPGQGGKGGKPPDCKKNCKQ